MRAFVLSGGGNMGPVQVGALRSLLERGVFPDFIVGCSSGSLNAGFLARELSLEHVEKLGDVWRSVTKFDVYPGRRANALWRLLSGKDSLYDNRNFYAFLQRQGVTPAQTFANLTVKTYITATHLHSGRLHVFGDDSNDRVLDAMMASTALTPMHPPYEVNGEMYVDGGTVTPLPLRVAMERGAKEIYALHLLDGEPEGAEKRLIKGVAGVLSHSVGTMLRLQAQHDLLLAEVRLKAKLHYIPLQIAQRPDPTDFGQAQTMIDAGYQVTEAYFARVKKGRQRKIVTPSLRQWVRSQATRLWNARVTSEAPIAVEVMAHSADHAQSVE